MIPEISYLTVKINNRPVGRLAMDKQRLCVFEYDEQWLQKGFSISPFHLPLEPGAFTAQRDPFDGLFGVFNDSLPDGWGNLLIDRWLKENGVDPGRLSWVERLSIVGDSGMGALCYEPATRRKPKTASQSLDFYAKEVHKILHEEEVASLSDWVERAGSPGGARPKILLELEGIQWLIKFPANNDPPDIGEIEYRYAEAAQWAGIDMPETRLFEGIYFGSARFDREGGNRIHMITASGLLHASHRYPSLDYKELLKATFYLTRSITEVKKQYRRMVFNVLTFNRDDHAKNFSFLYRDGEWECSPAYDLVYSNGFNGQHSTTINGKGNPSKDDMLTVGIQAGLKPNDAEQIYEEVTTATQELVAFVTKRFSL
ncbi:MAG: type II toxin-antitoxin system HipA family toxin [Bacteroidota bacterium]